MTLLAAPPRTRFRFASVLLVLALAGCAAPGPVAAPPTPHFVFDIPSTAAAQKPPMPIAILQAKSAGTLFVETVYGAPNTPQAGAATQRTRAYVGEMLRAEQTDLERVIIAKGFTSAGTFPNIEEMTFSQKETSVLLMQPEMEVNLDVVDGGIGAPQMVSVRGTIALNFLEPMSREKVWVKRIELTPFSKQVPRPTVSLADLMSPKKPQSPTAISQAGMVALLNEFYAASMSKIWDQLDPREILSYRKDAEKLKSRTNYRG